MKVMTALLRLLLLPLPVYSLPSFPSLVPKNHPGMAVTKVIRWVQHLTLCALKGQTGRDYGKVRWNWKHDSKKEMWKGDPCDFFHWLQYSVAVSKLHLIQAQIFVFKLDLFCVIY
jgi:hypothetical protein